MPIVWVEDQWWMEWLLFYLSYLEFIIHSQCEAMKSIFKEEESNSFSIYLQIDMKF